MNKLIRCSCGKLFVQVKDEVQCKTCSTEVLQNDDPFDVAPKNILTMVDTYVKIDATKVKTKKNILDELAFVLNQAWLRGYISEEFYESVALELNITPEMDEPISLVSNNYYDYSIASARGFYTEMCTIDED